MDSKWYEHWQEASQTYQVQNTSTELRPVLNRMTSTSSSTGEENVSSIPDLVEFSEFKIWNFPATCPLCLGIVCTHMSPRGNWHHYGVEHKPLLLTNKTSCPWAPSIPWNQGPNFQQNVNATPKGMLLRCQLHRWVLCAQWQSDMGVWTPCLCHAHQQHQHTQYFTSISISLNTKITLS